MESSLTLHGSHESLGAEFTSSMGFRVPAHYGDPVKECSFVQERVGVFDRSYRGSLSVRGAETTTFLDRLLSSEVAKLETGDGQLSTLLTPKGRVLGAFRIFRVSEDSYLLVFSEPSPEVFQSTLSKYAFLSDVQIANESDRRRFLSVEGPLTSQVLSSVVGGPLPSADSRMRVEFECGSHSVAVTPGGESPEKGYELEVPPEAVGAVWEALVEAALSAGGGPVGFVASEILRVEAGVPRFGVDYNEDNFPNEVGLDEALTYSKCYVGQEIVARMKTYGHSNRRLVGIRFAGEGDPRPMDRLVGEDEEAGFLTSVAVSPRCGCIALGLIHRRFWNPETTLTARLETGDVEVSVVDLPFVKPTTRP